MTILPRLAGSMLFSFCSLFSDSLMDPQDFYENQYFILLLFIVKFICYEIRVSGMLLKAI